MINKLNLITTVFRSGMLAKMKASMPDTNRINWIIVFCKEREILKAECEQLNLPYITVDIPEGIDSIHQKVNEGLKHIVPGYVQFLDDDTIFCPGALRALMWYPEYDLLVGEQLLKDGTKRPAQVPARCYTDGAQMLFADTVVKDKQLVSLKDDPQYDCEYMLRCWNSTKNHLILHEVISFYNWSR